MYSVNVRVASNCLQEGDRLTQVTLHGVASSFVHHRLILSTLCVGAIYALVNGPTSMRPASDGGRYSGQL